jgi:hypothetical protein
MKQQIVDMIKGLSPSDANDLIKDYLRQFGQRLYLHYEVKFRAFGITFANINGEIDLGQYSPVPVQDRLLFNERGVKLFIYTKLEDNGARI